jgi:putative transposase
LIPAEDRRATVALLQEGMSRGASIKAVADLFGVAPRTPRRWGLMIRSQGFSHDQRKGADRYVAHRFSREERQNVLSIVNDPRFADLPPGQIVAILAEEGIYVGSESTLYRIMRQEGLLNHRSRSRPPQEPREPPVLVATGIHQVLARCLSGKLSARDAAPSTLELYTNLMVTGYETGNRKASSADL